MKPLMPVSRHQSEDEGPAIYQLESLKPILILRREKTPSDTMTEEYLLREL